MAKAWELESDYRTDTGNVRRHNEDACITRDSDGIWVVADGMGGHHAGDVASKSIVDAVREMSSHQELPTLMDTIEDTITKVNEDLMVMARAKRTTIGSTVVGMAHRGDYVVIFWAGDSRVYRIRGKKMEEITQDHDMIQDLVESGVCTEEEAKKHPQAERVTRAVGGGDDFFLDMEIFELQKKDLFILCSDGLYKELTTDEILDISKSCKALDEIPDALVEAALARRGRDNVTVVAVEATA
jgi:serine/threonine protein phosphatase Stp1